jgi:hypothetical protein
VVQAGWLRRVLLHKSSPGQAAVEVATGPPTLHWMERKICHPPLEEHSDPRTEPKLPRPCRSVLVVNCW